ENVADEQRIGETFGQRRDFYRAITAFERGEILLRGSHIQTILQFQYEILLSYYLAGKYEEAFCYFEKSALKAAVTKTFPAWKDMLVIVYDSSCRIGRGDYAVALLKSIRLENPILADKLALYSAIRTGDLRCASQMAQAPCYLKKIYSDYCLESKSVNKARMMNALLPGVGYMYVKQVNTGITAMIVNAVFIGATYQFARKSLVFPAIICASLEVGWYVGGIWGAGRAAAEYNERLYENAGTKILEQERLYPLLMLDYAF
ncbi:MAG: hypothetical protein WCN87_03945, partial [Chlamydiota bacterium]